MSNVKSEDFVVVSWEGKGASWHSDHLSLSVHPLLNTAFFKLIFFFLSTALIFLATIAVAIIIIKLTEIVGWLVEVRKETMIKKEHCENKGQKKHCQRHKGPRVLTI